MSIIPWWTLSTTSPARQCGEPGRLPRFRRVGAIFENARRETGEVFLSVKLDFPVAVTELVGFPPRPEDDPASDEVTQS